MAYSNSYEFTQEHQKGHITSVDQIFENAQARQRILTAACHDVVHHLQTQESIGEGTHMRHLKPTDIALLDPGVKSLDRARAKCATRFDGDATQLYDVNRCAFEVTDPAIGDLIEQRLSEHFELMKGEWQLKQRGILERQIYVAIKDPNDGHDYVAEVNMHMMPPHQFPEMYKIEHIPYEIARLMSKGGHEYCPPAEDLHDHIFQRYKDFAQEIEQYTFHKFVHKRPRSEFNTDAQLFDRFTELNKQCNEIHDYGRSLVGEPWVSFCDKIRHKTQAPAMSV